MKDLLYIYEIMLHFSDILKGKLYFLPVMLQDDCRVPPSKKARKSENRRVSFADTCQIKLVQIHLHHYVFFSFAFFNRNRKELLN